MERTLQAELGRSLPRGLRSLALRRFVHTRSVIPARALASDKAGSDALHLALSAVNGMDFLATWGKLHMLRMLSF